MLMEVNGKMVSNKVGLCLCVLVLDCWSVLLISFVYFQVSSTEQCVGPMRLIQGPIQVSSLGLPYWPQHVIFEYILLVSPAEISMVFPIKYCVV